MVALLIELKLRLLRNSLRRSVWQLVGLIVGSLYALGLVGFTLVGLVALRFTDRQVAADVTTVAFTALSIGWLVLSLVVFGVDETVDPARFALLPVSAGQLVPGLLAAALLGIPGVATALVALGLLGTWSVGVAPLVGAAVAVMLGVPLCVLWSRAATAVFAQALASRRTRDMAALLFAILMMSLALGGNVLGNLADKQDPGAWRPLLHQAGAAAGWTPFGWVWAVPGLLAEQRWASAAAHLLLAVALTAALWLTWAAALRRNLTSPPNGGGPSRAVRAGTRLPRLYPSTPAGAIAVRCLRYWRRDPRYLAALVPMLILPVIFIVTQMLSTHPNTTVIAMAPLVLALMGSSTMAQDLAFDGSALSLHALVGVRGVEDRAGRVMAALTIVAPLLAVLLVLGAALSNRWDLLPVTVSLSAALLPSGLGAAMWVGTVFPGKAPPPGASPFTVNNTGGGLQSLASFAVTVALTVVCALPTAALVIGSLWVSWLVWVAVVAGVLTGTATLLTGTRLGGARLERHWPELLAQVTHAR